MASLLGRDAEIAQLMALVANARAGTSGALVVNGEAGIGKTALLDGAVEQIGEGVRLERFVASEAELELPYAGLQLLCRRLMIFAGELPAVQQETLETAFGIREAGTPNPLVLSLAVLGLLSRAAAQDGAMLCIVDDAQWLDAMSARTLASVARRLSTEQIAMVLAMRRADPPFADLPQLNIDGLGHEDVRTLLQRSLPGAVDKRLQDQVIAEARGNPLALRELPRTLGPIQFAGFPALESMPLEHRIEQSFLSRIEILPESTRMLLLLAAADPTGDPGLIWRAGAFLDLAPENLDAAQQADALVISGRVRFRHPLIRSAIYRAAAPADRRRAHAALADATYQDRDPDRRAWHRATATVQPTEEVAADLVRLAQRAQVRGGVAAAAAFLERAAELSPDPIDRVERVLAAAEAKLDAGAADNALVLVDNIRDQPLTPVQQALVGRVRARAEYALRRDRSAPRRLLHAAQSLEPYDPALARDTYMEALAAAAFAGRLGEPGAVAEVATAILSATADDDSDRATDLILRGQALLSARGLAAALPTVRRAIAAFLHQPADPRELHWMWLAGRAAQDIWDAEGLRTLAERQVRLARRSGVLTVLPTALSLLMVARTFDGDLDEAEAICDDIDAILSVTGHPLPLYGRIFVAAYRGQVQEVEQRAGQLRADAHARGEGYALTVANMAEALVYNGAGRYREALASARRELPYAHELGHAMRTLLELVEAACRTDEHALAEEAVTQLEGVTAPAGTEWSIAFMTLARAQLQDGDEAEALYQRAVDGFDRLRVPMLAARSRLLYGEMLRRASRRVDARVQLRAAQETLQACGMAGFADRAARELRATGERVRPRAADAGELLTEQERNVALLARAGLTNREIGARLFISAHTVEWHLRKVFSKLGITARTELRTVLTDRMEGV